MPDLNTIKKLIDFKQMADESSDVNKSLIDAGGTIPYTLDNVMSMYRKNVDADKNLLEALKGSHRNVDLMDIASKQKARLFGDTNPFFKRLADNTMDEGKDLMETVKGLFGKSSADAMTEEEVKYAEYISAYDQGFIDKCAEYGIDYVELLKEANLRQLWNMATHQGHKAVEGIKGVGGAALDKLKTLGEGALNVGHKGIDAVKGTGGALTSGADAAAAAVGEGISTAGKAVGKGAKKVKQTGKAVAKGIGEGVEKVKETGKAVAEKATGALPASKNQVKGVAAEAAKATEQATKGRAAAVSAGQQAKKGLETGQKTLHSVQKLPGQIDDVGRQILNKADDVAASLGTGQTEIKALVQEAAQMGSKEREMLYKAIQSGNAETVEQVVNQIGGNLAKKFGTLRQDVIGVGKQVGALGEQTAKGFQGTTEQINQAVRQLAEQTGQSEKSILQALQSNYGLTSQHLSEMERRQRLANYLMGGGIAGAGGMATYGALKDRA